MRRLKLIALLLTMTLQVIMAAEPVKVRASLRDSEIEPGGVTQLDLEIQNGGNGSEPSITRVDGLEFQQVGQSSRVNWINGVLSSSVTYQYRVFAVREGVFTIPPIQVKVGDKIHQSQPLTLQVKTGVATDPLPKPLVSRPNARHANRAQPRQPPSATPENPPRDPAGERNKELIRVELALPERDLYVGEQIPADFRLVARQGIQVRGLSPPRISEAFTMSKPTDKHEEKEELQGGIPCMVATWHPAISAIRAGEQNLEVQTDVTVQVPVKRRIQNPFFDDPFFNDLGGITTLETQMVTLKSGGRKVRVLELPLENRPENFDGAIGDFEISASAGTTSILAGDPLTLKVTVRGKGNFDRIRNVGAARSPRLKTYPSNGKFEPSDDSGYSGQKIFEQVLMPQGEDVKEIPPIIFSYFNPETGKFVTKATSPIPIQVKGNIPSNSTTLSSSVPASASAASTSPSGSIRTGAAELVPNKVEMGSPAFPSGILIFHPLYQGALAIPLLAWLGAWVIARKRKQRDGNPSHARNREASRSIRQQLAGMDQAVKQGDSRSFFTAARRAVQERLGEKWNLPPETITLAEVDRHMSPHDAPHESIHQIFDMADAITYSGHSFNSEALRDWDRAVKNLLAGLEKLK